MWAWQRGGEETNSRAPGGGEAFSFVGSVMCSVLYNSRSLKGIQPLLLNRNVIRTLFTRMSESTKPVWKQQPWAWHVLIQHSA